jgi:signal peptidase I
MNLFCSTKEFEELCRDVAGKADVIRLQVKGGSMFPFIRSGEWVDVVLCKDGERSVRKGDIILFRKAESLYLHRVIKAKGDLFIAKGDQSFGHDGAIPTEDIIAKVVAVERGGRKIDLCSRSNRTVSVFIANAASILQYMFLFSRKIASLSLAAIYRIQHLNIYRDIAKKILKPDISVREASAEDEEGMRDLFLMGGQDIRDGIAKIKKDGFWLVAENRGKIVGGLTVTSLEKDPGMWVIFGLEVKPLLRGIGIGQKLVEEALERAKTAGAREIGLFVNKKNIPALKLYQKAGFSISDDFPQEFNKSPDEFYLSFSARH